MNVSGKSNVNLGIDLLKSFVAVVDNGSFTVASRQLNSTQSTVSQQILRLEDMVGLRLLDRGRQGLTTTEAGESLLGYARRMLALNDEALAAITGIARQVTLRLGLPEDFASGRITATLARFVQTHPNVRLEVTSGLSYELFRSFQRGELDLTLIKQYRGERQGAISWPEPLAWYGSAVHPLPKTDPLPLVAFPSAAPHRNEMTAALDLIGRRWRLVYTSSSLAGLLSAIEAGMGVSLLPRRVVGSGLSEIADLPAVPPMEIVLHAADPDMPFAREVMDILITAIEMGEPA